MSQHWYIKTSQGIEGPFSPGEMKKRALDGRIDRSSSLSVDQHKWVRAEAVRGLAFMSKTSTGAGPVRMALAESANNREATRVDPMIVRVENPDGFGATHSAKARIASTALPDGLTESIVNALARSRGWVLFLAVVNFSYIALLLMGAVVTILRESSPVRLVELVLSAIFLAPIMFVVIIAAVYLLRYWTRLCTFLREPTMGSLESAKVAENSIWRLFGLIVIAILLFQFGLGLWLFTRAPIP